MYLTHYSFDFFGFFYIISFYYVFQVSRFENNKILFQLFFFLNKKVDFVSFQWDI